MGTIRSPSLMDFESTVTVTALQIAVSFLGAVGGSGE
jgi:hypothetical protein